MAGKYPGVEAYARGLYVKYRVDRLLRDIGAKFPTTLSTMNGAFEHAMEGISCDEFVESVIAKCPPLFLMITEDAIQSGEILIEFPVYEPRRYSCVSNTFQYAESSYE